VEEGNCIPWRRKMTGAWRVLAVDDEEDDSSRRIQQQTTGEADPRMDGEDDDLGRRI
jgi:hypothetical protein